MLSASSLIGISEYLAWSLTSTLPRSLGPGDIHVADSAVSCVVFFFSAFPLDTDFVHGHYLWLSP